MLDEREGTPGGTRGQILAYLRTTPRTVAEVAAHVGVSDNAVRAHLTSLQGAGLIDDVGTVHEGRIGKPAQRFRITEQGEERFPKAYATVLGEVLRMVAEREGENGVLELLTEVGRRVAGAEAVDVGSPASRVDATARLLRGMGADVEVVAETGDRWRIEGRGCPLSAVVRHHSQVCILVENLISRASGGAVAQRCEHDERPRCSFVIDIPRDSSG